VAYALARFGTDRMPVTVEGDGLLRRGRAVAALAAPAPAGHHGGREGRR
jgi:hypothetical protein